METSSRPLSEYLEELSFIIDGERVKRHHVVRYVSNKLGGTHYDEARNHRFDPPLTILDRVINRHDFLSKDAVYAAVLGIGQELIFSPDIRSLL